MTTHDQDDQPATTAGPCDDPTLAIWESEHAWSLDDSDDAELRPSWRRTAAVAAAVVMVSTAVAAATLLLGRTNGGGAQGGISNANLPTFPTIATTAPPTTVTSTVVVTSALPAPPSPVPPVAADYPDQDPNDRAFLQALQRDEIAVPDQTKALIAAHWVCTQLRGGDTRADVVTILKKSNPELRDPGAVDFTSDSVAFYCPQFAGG